MSARAPPIPWARACPALTCTKRSPARPTFADDMQFGPGLYYGRLVRSPHAHALIKRIDASKALELPGVKAVVTGADVPNNIGLYLIDRPIFARDRVRFVGEPVAGVVASSEEIAEEAAQLVEVEYEELPAVFDPVEGAQPEAPLLHPDLGEYEVANFIFPQPGTNISEHFKLRKGDVESAWPSCAAIVEGTFRLPQIQHVPIEPHVAVGLWELSGQVTLWTCSQSPFAQRDLIAQSLDIPHGNLRVVSPYVGGGFGGKAGVSMEVCAVVMARAVKGHPVKLRMTREEEFIGTTVRQSLVANDQDRLRRRGQPAGHGDRVLFRRRGLQRLWRQHRPRGRLFLHRALPHPQRQGRFLLRLYQPAHRQRHARLWHARDPLGHRADHGPARREDRHGPCRVPPAQLRQDGRHHPDRHGDARHRPGGLHRQGHRGHRLGQTRRACQRPHKRRGKGMAIMWKAPAMPPNPGSSAIVRFNEDATVNVAIGAQELGQGAFTVAGPDGGPGAGRALRMGARLGSRSTPSTAPTSGRPSPAASPGPLGNAVKAAAQDARRQILEVVAEHWGEDPEDLDIKDGIVISYASEEEQPLKNMVVYGLPNENFEGWKGGPIVGQGKFMPTYVTNLDSETGQGTRAVVHYTVGAQAVDLEVDTETGEVEVLKIASVYDVGKAINPDLVMTQIEGGAVHGMSSAFEALTSTRRVDL